MSNIKLSDNQKQVISELQKGREIIWNTMGEYFTYTGSGYIPATTVKSLIKRRLIENKEDGVFILSELGETIQL